MERYFFILLCASLQLYGEVTDSILPSMDEVYTLDLEKKVNQLQKESMRQATENKNDMMRVMTYNMKGAEEKLPEKYRWDKRKSRLLEYISYADADIIGSQELQKDQVDEVMTHWSGVCDCFGEKTRENEERADVNAIFFKKDRFELIEAKTIPYRDLQYENGFTVCVLKDKFQGKESVVINTKLTWGDPERRYAEAVQLNQFTCSLPKETSIIVLGDFNVFPCTAHKINLFLDGDQIEKVLAGDNLKDAKKKAIFGHFGSLCSITNSKTTLAPFAGAELTGFILDHVLVNDRIDVFTHGIDIARVQEEFPSDHFPVIADLKVN